MQSWAAMRYKGPVHHGIQVAAPTNSYRIEWSQNSVKSSLRLSLLTVILTKICINVIHLLTYSLSLSPHGTPPQPSVPLGRELPSHTPWCEQHLVCIRHSVNN